MLTTFYSYADNFMKTLWLIIGSILVCSLIFRWIRSRNYPPGPIGFPFIGYGFFLGKKPNLTLQRLGEKYGGIFSFYYGPHLYVCVNDFYMIKEILCHPNATVKAKVNINPKGGLGSLDPEEFREQRRFMLFSFQNILFRDKFWEKSMQDTLSELINEIKNTDGKPVFYETLLSKSLCINLMSMIFGRQINVDAEKEDIEIISRFSKQIMVYRSSIHLNISNPRLLKIIKKLNIKGSGDFADITGKFETIMLKEVQRRTRSKDEIVEDDLIGSYIVEMEKRKNERNSSYTEENLAGHLFAILIGALDGTVVSLKWLLLLMAAHPNVQRKINEEIDREIGTDGTVYYEDKNKLPYTFASIMEELRWSSHSGIFFPKCITESFTFRNYVIPRGAYVICNAYAMMHDPRYFENPMTYEPKRFLNSDGTVRFFGVESFGPFSFGKRKCPGEGLAFRNIFTYFVKIMQNFTIKPSTGKAPNLDYVCLAGLYPIPQDLCFIER